MYVDWTMWFSCTCYQALKCELGSCTAKTEDEKRVTKNLNWNWIKRRSDKLSSTV